MGIFGKIIKSFKKSTPKKLNKITKTSYRTTKSGHKFTETIKNGQIYLKQGHIRPKVKKSK